ncbi:leishmanolysin-like peptidase 2 [Nematolebias whitei]|uniref:leishmanolysin-like peptidase 2 n=1 Tax=Nematolebias whitei TaxID=451745 RepID=UPI001896BD97|nr:leishmanolysin-like peptidase 2 [Nematolebias whitei]
MEEAHSEEEEHSGKVSPNAFQPSTANQDKDVDSQRELHPGPLLLSRDINKYCKFLWKNSSTVNYNSFLLTQPNVLAYAVHCQTDPWGRPVAGVVVLCRDGLTGDTYDHRTTVQTVIHELFHALGFSKDLFSTWRDCSSSYQGGAPCSPRGKVIHSDESGQVRVYTPSIISALQKHLVSTDPELGGPLENLDGSAGRGSSHWESRVLQGSIMTAVLGDPTTVRIDPVTLAALQDTGWYRVNQSRAQSLVWGDSGGASFGSLSTCKHNSSTFFCTGSGVGCHFLHLHKGACQTDPYLEGCRVYKPIQNQSKCWRKETIRQSDEESGEVFGFDSRCFFSSLTRQRHFRGFGSTSNRRPRVTTPTQDFHIRHLHPQLSRSAAPAAPPSA